MGITPSQLAARRRTGKKHVESGHLASICILGGIASQALRTPEQRIEYGQLGADKVGLTESTRQGIVGGIKGAELAGHHEMKRRSIWAMHLRHHARKERVNVRCSFCPDKTSNRSLKSF